MKIKPHTRIIVGAITRWGGKIDVGSQPNEGTIFTIWLPVWPTTDTPDEFMEQPVVQSPAKILIIDDDPITTQYLEHILSPNHDVQVVLDAQTAVDQFEPGQYDIAFIDLGMPNLLGDKVAQSIRLRDPLMSTVLITGWTLEEGDPRLAPFDFFLPKPIQDHHKVHQIIAQAIQRRNNRASNPR